MATLDNFQAKFIKISSLTFVTTTGSITVPIHGILNVTPLARQYKTAKYTPISGTYSGKEQVLALTEQAPTMEMTCIYDSAHHKVVDDKVGLMGTVTLTLDDNTIIASAAGNACLTKNALGQFDDSGEAKSAVTIESSAGWTFTQGS
jgi:hypothetical protein